jgi:hypothetical protein
MVWLHARLNVCEADAVSIVILSSSFEMTFKILGVVEPDPAHGARRRRDVGFARHYRPGDCRRSAMGRHADHSASPSVFDLDGPYCNSPDQE